MCLKIFLKGKRFLWRSSENQLSRFGMENGFIGDGFGLEGFFARCIGGACSRLGHTQNLAVHRATTDTKLKIRTL